VSAHHTQQRGDDPQLGFGPLGVPPGRRPSRANTEKPAEIVGLALEVGYRHIDTAQMYGNERGVGEALAAQVVLRWHIERRHIIIPKSTHRERTEENLPVFDFELSSQEAASIDALDKRETERIGPNPDTFAWIA